MKISKATREQLKRHNRLLLLRAVYAGLADNRAALANETGLAKPTVSDLIAEMIEEGFLVESGRGESTDSGGKRPTLLQFVPDARQVIGVSLDNGRISGVLSNLAGQIIARHYADLQGTLGPAILDILNEVINGLRAQLDAPLLCIGIGVPGVVDTDTGQVHHSTELEWHSLPLGQSLEETQRVPVYIGNSAELTALGQFAFGLNQDERIRNLVTIMVNDSIEIGVTLERVAYHHGVDISPLRLHLSDDIPGRLYSRLGWAAIVRRVTELRRTYPDSLIPAEGLTYLHIRYGAANHDPAALQLFDELSTILGQIFGWVIGILRPDHLTLAGPAAELGEDFLNIVTEKATAMLTPDLTEPVTFSLASSKHLSAIGAAALALQKELDIL
ncbi:MAG TPA: ROK family transcriptional regulator [Phototrophicaceae bacterium]|nr:ROK family transcriptional regulator [Phototrophicaceae bacterium]